ncbi:type VII secretion integral membrane protein EccD [Modestobacter versicolor]|uniref:Type VII secretion integral membrane protein EccD n=1 Tax=Modestobacter versicolor TaxID=429133 RepID=A0A839Y3S5_9ACTN|nr:type VII secretion integral membrane protein EccD [Modestobacter versicolor]MBB3677838.1 type VII secretion integral membrane protein EccD [Modestobacter versicolor]
MTAGVTGGLARVTIAAPTRRVDVALPEAVPVAELLPAVLRSAGEGLADDGQQHGGWVLRTAEGTLVDPARSLAAQELRDGEVLHLVPRRVEWPELDYDDVVDAIARDARRESRSWGSAATRRAGLAVVPVAVLAALVLVLTAGPSWTAPGGVALALAALLLLGGVAVARALGDAGAGMVLAVSALPAAALGGLLVLQGDQPLTGLQPAQWLLAAAVLLVAALLGYVGVADRTHWCVAAVVVALLVAVVAGTAALTPVDGRGAAALLVALVVVLTPAVPLLSIRLGKLPLPALPTTAEDLLADAPQVPRPRVQARVRRTDELLTGMLGGGAVLTAAGSVLLVRGGVDDAGVAPVVLAGLVAAAGLLRARLFPAVRHRVPQLVAGAVGLVAVVAAVTDAEPSLRLAVGVPVLVAVAGLALAAGLAYQRRPPSPWLGRLADVLDVLVVMAVLPVAFVVVGLYGYVRGIAG